MKIAVTGATGFLGSHIAEALRADAHDVTLFVRDPARLPFDTAGFRIARGDITDAAAFAGALSGMDAVVHSAAKVGEWGAREEFEHANVGGMRALIDACGRTGVRRVVYISTMDVYGTGSRPLRDTPEETPYRKTGVLYSDSKIEAEKLFFEAHAAGTFAGTAIRPAMVWGPRDPAFVPKLIEQLDAGFLPYIGGGRTRIGLTHVDNVVEIVRLCLAKDVSHGRAYNVDDDDTRTFREFVEALCRRIGKKPPRLSVPVALAKPLAALSEWFGHAVGMKKAPLMTKLGIAIFCSDNDISVERAKRELGYRPQDRFDERLDAYLRALGRL